MQRGVILRFLLSRAASSLGDQFLMFAVPLIVYRSTGSVAMSGLAFFIEWLPRICSLPIAGNLCDRLDSWRVYGFADTARAIACACVAWLALATPSNSFPIIASLSAVCAFFYAQAFIALESTVPRLVMPEQMHKAQALLQAIDQTASIAGPALAALLAARFPPSGLLWVAASVFGLSALLVWSLRNDLHRTEPRSAGHRQGFNAGVAAAVGVLRDKPVLWALIALSMGVNLIVGVALATGAAITTGRFGLPNSLFGFLQTIVGAVALASFLAVPYLTRRLSVYWIGVTAFGMIVVGGLLMGMASSFPVFVLGYALSFASCGLFNVYIRTERAHWIPRDQLGRVLSLIVLLNQLSLPVAGLIVATFGGRLGVQPIFIAVSMLGLLTYAALWRYLQRNSRTADSLRMMVVKVE
ncbi:MULTISPECIES: MFS transporter [unclassified Caballeronia]|uniref:MFS transporter n=1 Tax=unclassified Caballeronia TaxID=2646786 RepID=UPI002027B407|nr:MULTISPECIES: MFS transporter [unclassified Caballeronia]